MALIEGNSRRDTHVQAPAPTPPRTTHTVQSGQSGREIAVQHRIPADRIAAANPHIADLAHLGGGERLDIPEADTDAAPPLVYHAEPGESLAEIAERHGTTEQALQIANALPASTGVPGPGGLLIPAGDDTPSFPVSRYGGDTAAIDAALVSHDAARQQLNAVGSAATFATIALDTARDRLDAAVRDSLQAEAARTLYPPGTALGAANIDQLADGLIAHYAGNPVEQQALRTSVDAVRLELEVESLRAITNGADPARIPALLDTALAGFPPQDQARLLAEPDVQSLLDAAADYAAEPLQPLLAGEANDPTTNVGDALTRLDGVIADVDPRIASAVTARVLDQLEDAEQALTVALNTPRDDTDEFLLEAHGPREAILIDQDSLVTLSSIADGIQGTPQADALTERLAGIALTHTAGPDAFTTLDTPIRNGSGVELSLAIAAQADARYGEVPGGGTYAELIRQRVVDEVQAFADGPLADGVDTYLEHTAQLGFIAGYGGAAESPEALQSAIQAHIDRQGPEWQEELERLEAEVAADGVDLLDQIVALDALPAAQREVLGIDGVLATLLSGDAARVAISTATGSRADLLADTDISAAISVIDGLELATGAGTDLLTTLANAQVQSRVLPELGQIDPSDPASVERARTAIDTLRNDGFAEAWGISPSQLDEVLTALQDTVPTEGMTEAQSRAALADYNTRLGEIDAFGQHSPQGQAFRALGLAASVAGLAQSAPAFVNDPSFVGAVQLLADTVGLAADIGELGNGLSVLADSNPLSRLAANPAVAKLLGGAGLLFGTIGVVQSASEGDWSQAALGGLATGGSAVSLAASLGWFAGASWAGPVGLAVAAFATAGSLGLTQYRRVQASNEFDNDESAAFLQDLGFTPEAAGILVDQTGDGISPVPLLLRYGDLHGLDGPRTVEYLNGLSGDDLTDLRQAVHRSLDAHGTDPAAFGETADGDADAIAQLDNPNRAQSRGGGNPERYFAPESATQLDAYLERLGIAPPPDVSTEFANFRGNEVTWTLDESGRPIEADAVLTDVFSQLPRSSAESNATREVGNSVRSSDDGGHIIGHRFMGNQGLRNLFPQDSNFNRSAYLRLENEWADWTRQGWDVRIEVSLAPVGAERPETVTVEYEVVNPETGDVVYDVYGEDSALVFDNEAGQTFDRVNANDMPRYYG